MLALTRKVDEGIIINGAIEIKVLGIQDGKVKLGIEAPKEMSIHRKEVYLSIEENNKKAVSDLKELVKVLKKGEKASSKK